MKPVMSVGRGRRPYVRRVVTLGVAVGAVVAGLSPPGSATGLAPPPPDRSVLQELIERSVVLGYPGVLVHVEDEAGTWSGTAGVADVRTREPLRTDSRWRIASVTKPLVATAVLQLVADGALGLDDTVEEVYPGLLTGPKADQITIRQLLAMRSGLAEYIVDPMFTGPRNPVGKGGPWWSRWLHEVCDGAYDPGTLVSVSDSDPLYFPPGTQFDYANVNYIVLGVIIQHLTGNNYQDAISEQILEPNGLSETTFLESGPLPEPHPSGYTTWFYSSDSLSDHPIVDVTDCNTSAFGAAGSGVSDADDLTAFLAVLLDGALIPDGLLHVMLDTGDAFPGYAEYGLGIMRFDFLQCGVEVVGYEGRIPGFSTFALSTEDGARRMTIMANMMYQSNAAYVSLLDLIIAEYCGAIGF